MSADSDVWRTVSGRVRRGWYVARTAVFGDRIGVTLFLAVALFLVLTWRVGSFFNDIGLFGPMLERLSAGHLSLGTPSSVDAGYPGMHLVDGLVYGRNYGQVALSLPAYWLVQLLGVTTVRILIVVGWSLGCYLLVVRMATHYGRRRRGQLVGGLVALVALGANAVLFRGFVQGQAEMLALQATTLLVVALSSVLLYRLVAEWSSRKVGVVAGATMVFATPVGFWGTIPKRHPFAAALVMVALYGFYRSRSADRSSPHLGTTGYRALAYATVGLLAWIHAPEGFTLFLALVIVDVPTAPRNDRRTLAIVGGVFVLSLVPFLVTNMLIAGNPLEPPRFTPGLSGLDALQQDPSVGGESGPGGSMSQSGGQSSTPTGGFDLTKLLQAVFPPSVVTLLQRGILQYVDGATLVFTDPSRLVAIFGRWGERGYNAGNIFLGTGTNLSVVESAPILAGIVVAPVVTAARHFRRRTRPTLNLKPTDAFALVAFLLFLFLYLPRLPLRVMITVRYLHPVYPLLVYALFRQRWLRDALERHTEFALWGYEAAVLFGSIVPVGLLLVTSLSKGEFMQLWGPFALVLAAALVFAALVSPRVQWGGQTTALAFGVAAGFGTAFLLLSAFVLMHYGPSALPAVDTISAELRFAILRFG